MHSLGDILASGKYHQAVEGVLKRANDVASRDSESYRASLSKREQARAAILSLMNERGITAFVYPTLRRKPAVIGQPQNGSKLSAECGDRIPGDECARGIHVGRSAGGHGSPRAAVERTDAPQSRVRVRARVRPAQAAEDDSAARCALRFSALRIPVMFRGTAVRCPIV